MRVKVYVINEGTSSQYYGLKNADENTVLTAAPNNWKSKRGAENWANKHGYTVIESSRSIQGAASGAGLYNRSVDLDGYGADKSRDSDYLKKLADGVVEEYNNYFMVDNLVYEISDVAITFIDGDVVIYIQPLDGIKPDMDDIDSDIEELADSVIGAAIPMF